MSRKKISSAILLTSLVFSSCHESVLEPGFVHFPEKKGFSYTSFSSDGFTRGAAMMGELKSQIRNTWISFVVFEYQRNASSTSIAPNTTGINPVDGSGWPSTSTLDDLREAVRQARALSMRVMLKPHIDLYDGHWRATIQPDAAGIWFSAYKSMMMKYAALSEELGIEMLCIGDEYVVATQPKYTLEWRSIISSIRSVYRGKLIYAANWSGSFANGLTQPEFDQVRFWNDLDYIGVDSYIPLTETLADSIPLFDAAVSLMQTQGQAIGSLSRLQNRAVVFTETGIQSVRGALAAPWDFSLGSAASAVSDTNVQNFYYRVMIEAMGKQSWCDGIFWWNWETVPTSNESVNYTPRNKPAATTLREWYSSNAI